MEYEGIKTGQAGFSHSPTHKFIFASHEISNAALGFGAVGNDKLGNDKLREDVMSMIGSHEAFARAHRVV